MSRQGVLQNNPKATYLDKQAEINVAISRVLERGWYILGQETSVFEKDFAAAMGCRFGVGVGNGTDALVLALRTLGMDRGQKVATVTNTAVATVAAIEMAGAKPLLVDIDPATCMMDPALLERALADGVRAGDPIAAVIVVHLWGHPADVAAIGGLAKRYGASLIEDCAQAHGATFDGKPVGSFGAMACFSFYPTKNLGAFGDGGMVTTNEEKLAVKARAIREYGWTDASRDSKFVGINSRLDELQAAILRVKLGGLEADNRRRQAIAARYDAGLPDHAVRPERDRRASHVFHQYVIRSHDRNGLREALQKAGIGTGIHYALCVHQQTAYRGRVAIHASGLEHAEKTAGEILSLPMYPQLTEPQIEATLAAVNSWSG